MKPEFTFFWPRLSASVDHLKSKNPSFIKALCRRKLQEILVECEEDVLLQENDGKFAGQLDCRGKKHGTGLFIWQNGDTYEGEFSKDLPHGVGRFRSSYDGSVFVGEFQKGYASGNATWISADGDSISGNYAGSGFEGTSAWQQADGWHGFAEFKNGKLHGVVRGVSSYGASVVMHYDYGLIHGTVIRTYQSFSRTSLYEFGVQHGDEVITRKGGGIHIRPFVNGREHGTQIQILPCGARMSQHTFKGFASSSPVWTLADGTMYVGDHFVDASCLLHITGVGRMEMPGKENAPGDMVHGTFVDGKPSGVCMVTDRGPKGTVFIGTFKKGLRSGRGLAFEGPRLYDVAYRDGRLLSKSKVTGCGREALVVGNGLYESHLELKHATTDALSVCLALRRMNFRVMFVANASKEALQEAMDRWLHRFKNARTAIFYYAGHAIEQENDNLLLSVNYKTSLPLASCSVPFLPYLNRMSASEANICILDCCRDNAKQVPQPLPPLMCPRMYVAYATASGCLAYDGKRAHSIYTEQLLLHAS
mmetsp:Transcript_43988/g.71567  ORF Transcript_43988/g.71567 Transcript_43988/m.71567 type:complete len:534 (+) Transcript_43988:124-1725(+)